MAINKSLNNLLFFLSATAVTVVLMFTYFLLLLGIAGILFPVRVGFFATAAWIFLFTAAVVGAFFTYQGLFHLFLKHVEVDKYFDGKFFRKR